MTVKLKNRGIAGYACGMLGWSIMTNIITVMLIYIYQPPNNANLSPLVPQVAIFGFLSVLSLIVASGRLIDAVTDPLIAFFSDHSKHKKGRRIPFMQWSVIPIMVTCILIFVPFSTAENALNYIWLGVMQALFYISMTVYIVPYTALLPELASSREEKVYFSAWLSAGFVLGIIISSQTPWLADLFMETMEVSSRLEAMQYAIGSLSLLSGLLMIIPTLTIDESIHCKAVPSSLSLKASLAQALGNRNFRKFVLAEALYIVAMTIIVSGLLYMLRVLLELEEALGGLVMGVMVIISLMLYPLILWLVKRYGEKKILLFSLAYLSILMLFIFFLGEVPLPPKVQIFGFAVVAAFPLATLGILPYAIIAELAEKDQRVTHQQQEAMYFAVRNLAIKIGQTLGVAIFAFLIIFGKDPDNDFGIRLTGLVGSAICLLAFLTFYGYEEDGEHFR
jgi:GPH family glycoside/pentoside/hexuronide:cation symporter